mmetsp:Transcript_1683/g.3747  ORF Transcript_1683/g.3747 Transcript_1683/m.3747 type:complete len:92 (-) Transcript_1683:128-403(-)
MLPTTYLPYIIVAEEATHHLSLKNEPEKKSSHNINRDIITNYNYGYLQRQMPLWEHPRQTHKTKRPPSRCLGVQLLRLQHAPQSPFHGAGT